MASKIKISVIKPQHCSRILDFLRKHYYSEEPLTIGSEPHRPVPAEEHFLMSNIVYGASVMATNQQEDKIIGATITNPKDPQWAEFLNQKACKHANEKYGQTIRFLADIERNANVWKYFNVEKALHVQGIGVHRKMRGHHFGEQMLEFLEVIGKDLGYPVITADCTSMYSALLFERLGYECINVAYYRDYRDDAGVLIFNPPPPHDATRTYAKRLC